MKQKDFNKTINEVLNEGKIENQDIKNIDILRKILYTKKIKKSIKVYMMDSLKITRWNMVPIVIIF